MAPPCPGRTPAPSIPLPAAQPHQARADLAGAHCQLKLVCKACPFARAGCQIRDHGALGRSAPTLTGKLDMVSPLGGHCRCQGATGAVAPGLGRTEVVQGAHGVMQADQCCPAHAARVLRSPGVVWTPSTHQQWLPRPCIPHPVLHPWGLWGTLARRSRSTRCSSQGCQPRHPHPSWEHGAAHPTPGGTRLSLGQSSILSHTWLQAWGFCQQEQPGDKPPWLISTGGKSNLSRQGSQQRQRGSCAKPQAPQPPQNCRLHWASWASPQKLSAAVGLPGARAGVRAAPAGRESASPECGERPAEGQAGWETKRS
ncbi:uncharacterized protein LOC122152553 [Tyto alba]|uniref:uncharacterized protein LOC122152504 n=1 Tax=Tyto alba TaxID=56313 RepID=UPI001C6756B7|nr:uncharacterized protein LOC122152504 [Tyto alba]XP_042641061.1 uncharacterized protein LOC122152553 [Tyto alba]